MVRGAAGGREKGSYAGGSVKMDETRRHYGVRIASSGYKSRVMVNDVPVFDDRLGFGGVVTIPINKWIRHGANQVSAQLLPLVSAARADQREFSAQVTAQVAGSDVERGAVIATLLRPHAEGLPNGPIEISQVFLADVTFPEWAWFRSRRLDLIAKELTSLQAQVQRVHSLMAQEDIDALLSLFAERISETAAANYETIEEQRAASRRELAAFTTSIYLRLQPLDMETAQLRLYGTNRLVLLETVQGHSPIAYQSEDGAVRGYVPLIFRRTDEGTWVVTR